MSDFKDMGRSCFIAEIQALSRWRDLALQFDNHRMEALWHLKRVLADENQTRLAEIFLSKPPLSASEIVAERDQLKAENEALRKDAKYWSEAHDRELAWSAQLIEEREELRKDAERYRLMREMTLAQTDDAPDEFDSAFDSQLDAALGQGEQS